MKKYQILVLLTALVGIASAQEKLMTKSGNVNFISETPIENIQAENYQVASIFYKKEKKIVFSVPLRAFKFEKALMEEHFNEKYVHSDKFPSAKFVGIIETDINFDKPGKYKEVEIKGTMYFHGVEKELNVKGEFDVKDPKNIEASSTFKLVLSDYNIKIPSIVRKQISESVNVTINLKYE